MEPVRTKIWDPLLRGFHWLLAAAMLERGETVYD